MSGAVASWRGNRRDHVATDPVESPVLPPEQELALGVLSLALNDLFHSERELRDAARAFCILTTDGWPEWRRFWCELANIDESAFHTAARRKLGRC